MLLTLEFMERITKKSYMFTTSQPQPLFQRILWKNREGNEDF